MKLTKKGGNSQITTEQHHCRNCFEIFCNECSNYRMKLPHKGINKKVRVCSKCFSKLSNLLDPNASSSSTSSRSTLTASTNSIFQPSLPPSSPHSSSFSLSSSLSSLPPDSSSSKSSFFPSSFSPCSIFSHSNSFKIVLFGPPSSGLYFSPLLPSLFFLSFLSLPSPLSFPLLPFFTLASSLFFLLLFATPPLSFPSCLLS